MGPDPGPQPCLSSGFLTPPSRISLAGSEPVLVQGALGQSMQLFCSKDASLDPQVEWHKDGQPISSDRYVLQWQSCCQCDSLPTVAPLASPELKSGLKSVSPLLAPQAPAAA